MFALGIRYLNGFVAASEPDARERPEWPPHPARVFMALAAAHFETGADLAERAALEWLESLPPPRLQAPSATARAVVTHYVPVNDKPGDRSKPPTAIIQSIPQLARDRQARGFARAWLEEEIVYLAWPEAEAGTEVARALEGLAAKVTRIGHSTSLVQMWLAGPDEAAEATWVPDEECAEVSLRVAEPGTLAELERRYNAEAAERYGALVLALDGAPDTKARREARKELKQAFGDEPPPRLRPQIPLYQGYARAGKVAQCRPLPGTVWSPHLVGFTLEPADGPYRALGLAGAAGLVARWREALLSRANDGPDSVRQIVSGHAAGGSPLEGPHLAFVPLAFVGHPHADGHLLGVAAALPAELAPAERREVLRVLGRVTELRLGPLGVWRLGRELGPRPRWALRPEAWTAHPEGATHWATVTPVAFDRHPRAKDRAAYQREAAEMIAAGCEAIGLPRPREVVVTSVSAHLGVPPAHVFPRLTRKDGSERRHAHAILVFEEPVVGPMLIGAGRYRGYGLARPVEGT